MKYTKLGPTGLDVSRICLGCMSFGDSGTGNHTWTLDEEASRGFIKDALDAGINFFDTANVYSLGTSEEIVGRALADFADRDEVVIATKVHGPMRRGRNAAGLSRKAIMTEVDASLRRLGMDYIDLYQIHRFDPRTPIEETMEALHDVVKSGKVRYIGASSMWAWQFSKAQYTAELHGWTKFVTHAEPLQPPQSRRGARDDAAVRRPGRRRHPVEPAGPRQADARLGRHDRAVGVRRVRQASCTTPTATGSIVERVAEIADERGVPRAQVALAWMLSKPFVTSPIVGSDQAAPHHRRRRCRRGRR